GTDRLRVGRRFGAAGVHHLHRLQAGVRGQPGEQVVVRRAQRIDVTEVGERFGAPLFRTHNVGCSQHGAGSGDSRSVVSCLATARASRRKRSSDCGSFAIVDDRTLIATGRWSMVSSAEYTTPMPPFPSLPVMRYFPSRCSPRDLEALRTFEFSGSGDLGMQ